jgi:hypothetical protein
VKASQLLVKVWNLLMNFSLEKTDILPRQLAHLVTIRAHISRAPVKADFVFELEDEKIIFFDDQ